METEELIKLVDGIYKNILDKFNPGARQMINAGKAYLKALHGAAAASRMYVDAISKLAKQAQQGTWGGSSDIGAALMKVVEVYKEIQDQQMNILKAFYVDLLVPLETNLEKDTKVVQSEQKRFLQQHKQRSETYSKAVAMMKKQRKKSRGSTKSGLAMDKELKNMQVLEEEKTKLDAFCEQSLKNAMTQERRRYGFVLERQCSLAKHYYSYHTHGAENLQQNIENWSDVAKTREYLPESVENIFSSRLRQISVWNDEDLYSNPRSPNFEEDRISLNSQLRKTKSMDASCLDIRSIQDATSPVNTMSRAKSEYNLNSSPHNSEDNNVHTPTRRPKSMAVPPPPAWDTQLARALYAYLSSGENQLSFHEGDLIALIGERNKGWQFGENLRTQCSGWFPLAYTEILLDDTLGSPTHRSDASSSTQQHSNSNAATPTNMMSISTVSGGTSSNINSLDQHTPTRLFGDTLHIHRSSNNAKQIRRAIGSNNIPPPALPAPVPTPSLPYQKSSASGIPQSQSTNFPSSKAAMMDSGNAPYQSSQYSAPGIKSSASAFNFNTPSTPTGPYSTHPAPVRTDRPSAGSSLPLHLQTKGGGPVGNVSLHSSNDSGFSNDPPPQPEIDYSDDESMANGQTKIFNNRESRRDPRENNKNGEVRSSTRQSRPNNLKPSNSHGNLIENRYNTSDDLEVSRVKVKRTKSFWKFGKNNDDNEILEGMALWRHRDLVDLEDENNLNKINSQQRIRKPSRDMSNDSDRTLNNKENTVAQNKVLREQQASNTLRRSNDKVAKDKEREAKKNGRENEKRIPKDYEIRKPKESSKMSLPPRKETSPENEDFENIYGTTNTKQTKNFDDQFYDDDGDGLMVKTVNRKNILQQYNSDINSEEDESVSASNNSDMTSDDPYQCIVVNDQVRRNEQQQFPNVAEIGKKLEKLSKSSKYQPNKENKLNNSQESEVRAEIRGRNEINISMRRSKDHDQNLIQYKEYRENRHSFKTFGIEDVNDDKVPEENARNNTQERTNKKRNHTEQDNEYKDRYTESNKQRNSSKEKQRRNKPSYESINSEMTSKSSRELTPNSKSSNEKRSSKYYDSAGDELSDVASSKQFLPRTKLGKTNSNSSSKYDQSEISLMEYGETLQRRLKNPEYNSKYDEKSPHNGNMYGPWYDLWGLDASTRK